MKLYFKLAAWAAITMAWFGVIVPGFISAASDIMFVAGVLGIIVYPVFSYKFFTNEIKEIKKAMEKL